MHFVKTVKRQKHKESIWYINPFEIVNILKVIKMNSQIHHAAVVGFLWYFHSMLKF